MMSTKNIIKYGLLWGLLIWAMVVRGQQVEILHEGEDPVWLSDFKKKGGYLESIRLSKEYDLYRQNFCGCVYSRQKMEDRES